MKPFQLFLIINFIMLLSSSILFNENIFSSSFQTHTKAMMYADFASDLIKNEHLQIGFSSEDYERKFNQRLNGYSQTLIFLLIPFFALAIKLLNVKKCYIEHLVNSIHSLSFFLLVFGVLFSPLVALIDSIYFTYLGRHLGDIDNILIPFIFLSLGTYLTLSFKTIYNNSIFTSILKSIILIPAFFVMLIGYKFFLFLIVFGSLKIY